MWWLALFLMALGAACIVWSRTHWVAVAVFLFGAVFVFRPAFGQDAHKHRPQDADLHMKFYRTWMMPDNRAISCCHDQDCQPSASRLVSGKWQAQRDGEWIEVPDQKVEHDRDSPDGQSHYCGIKINGSWYTYCFLPAPGT